MLIIRESTAMEKIIGRFKLFSLQLLHRDNLLHFNSFCLLITRYFLPPGQKRWKAESVNAFNIYTTCVLAFCCKLKDLIAKRDFEVLEASVEIKIEFFSSFFIGSKCWSFWWIRIDFFLCRHCGVKKFSWSKKFLSPTYVATSCAQTTFNILLREFKNIANFNVTALEKLGRKRALAPLATSL